MKQFPIFVSLAEQRVIIVGGGEAALAKLRLLLKTKARLEVYAETADPQIVLWADEGRLRYFDRSLVRSDLADARLVYAATEDATEDGHIADMAREKGILVNIVDDLSSDFFTPAIVDRDPVVVAIGTEGAAPVLARKIKSQNEAQLPDNLGSIAQIANGFRYRVVRWSSTKRRTFWQKFWDGRASRVFANDAEMGVKTLLENLYASAKKESCVKKLGTFCVLPVHSDDAEMLSIKAWRTLDQADIVITDAGISKNVLELARREALQIALFQKHHDPQQTAESILAEIEEGARVVCLQSQKQQASPVWQRFIDTIHKDDLGTEESIEIVA